MMTSYETLKEIGRLLMKDEYPRIHPGGVIALDTLPVLSRNESSAKEIGYVQATEGPGRSSARQGQGTEGGEGPARGPGSSLPDAPLSRETPLTGEYGERVEEARYRYPQVRYRVSSDALWLFVTSRPLRDCPDEVYLVTRYPQDEKAEVRSWAWWLPGIWVGPRHTNSPDGSICSYAREDRTWHRGLAIDRLFDLHMLWAVKHLHLRVFQYWPGRQLNRGPLERVLEQAPCELCGCGSGFTYEACHRMEDQEWRAKRELLVQSATFNRRPPPALLQYLAGRCDAPDEYVLSCAHPGD